MTNKKAGVSMAVQLRCGISGDHSAYAGMGKIKTFYREETKAAKKIEE